MFTVQSWAPCMDYTMCRLWISVHESKCVRDDHFSYFLIPTLSPHSASRTGDSILIIQGCPSPLGAQSEFRKFAWCLRSGGSPSLYWLPLAALLSSPQWSLKSGSPLPHATVGNEVTYWGWVPWAKGAGSLGTSHCPWGCCLFGSSESGAWFPLHMVPMPLCPLSLLHLKGTLRVVSHPLGHLYCLFQGLSQKSRSAFDFRSLLLSSLQKSLCQGSSEDKH